MVDGTIYKVVSVTKDIASYPECASDTKQYPQLVRYVEDDMDIFVVHEEDGTFFKASDFFQSTSVRRFRVLE